MEFQRFRNSIRPTKFVGEGVQIIVRQIICKGFLFHRHRVAFGQETAATNISQIEKRQLRSSRGDNLLLCCSDVFGSLVCPLYKAMMVIIMDRVVRNK